MKRRIQTTILVIAMALGLLCGCTIGDTEYVLDLNTVGRNDVISVNGEECSLEEAKLYLCNYQNLYGNEYGVNLWEYEFSTEEVVVSLEEYIKDITVLQLSNIMCMNQLAEQREITLSEEEKSLAEQAADAYYKSLTEQELKYIGMDKKELNTFYTKYAVAQKLYEHLTQGVNEEVSLDEARAVRIEQIYVTSLEKAKEVQAKLKDGDDFSNVAGAYNEAAEVETTIVRGQLPENAEKILYAMDDGQQSDMIEVPDGYYFLKCLLKYDDELTEKNKEHIIEKRRKEQFDDVFNAFVEESEFEINQKLWDSVAVDITGEIKTDSFFEVYDIYFAKE